MRIAKILLTALLLLTVSCGDASRNDQGISFTFLAWYDDPEGEVLRTAFPAALSAELGVFGFAGLQNNLAGEFIRVNRVHHEYFIPGSDISIPGTSTSVGVNLGPADIENSNSSLPGTFTQGNIAFLGTAVVPAQVLEFLVLNQTQLPTPPFTMIVSSQAEGTTTSGRSITTNFIETDVIFTSPLEIGDTGTGDNNLLGGGAAGGDDTVDDAVNDVVDGLSDEPVVDADDAAL